MRQAKEVHMMTEQKIVTAFEFQDCGVDHAQYFPGVGVAYTDWDEVFLGCGDTAHEAADDATESMYSANDAMLPGLMAQIDTAVDEFDDTESAHSGDCTTEHGPNCEMMPEGPDD